MGAKLIGKFITQQVAAAMAKKTKQNENKLKNWRKVGRTEYQESRKKLNEGQWTCLQEKENIHDSDDYEFQDTQTICVLLVTRPKYHPLEPLERKKPKIRQCR